MSECIQWFELPVVDSDELSMESFRVVVPLETRVMASVLKIDVLGEEFFSPMASGGQ